MVGGSFPAQPSLKAPPQPAPNMHSIATAPESSPSWHSLHVNLIAQMSISGAASSKKQNFY
jgi:hypothetical protein